MVHIYQPNAYETSGEFLVKFFSRNHYYDILKRIKSYGGYQIKEEKCWKIQIDNVFKLIQDLSTLQKEIVQVDISFMGSYFKNRAKIDEILTLRNQIDEVNVQVDLSNGFHLLPFQKVGVKFIDIVKNGIIADKVGLGKTIQGIAVGKLFKETNQINKCFVVVPSSLKVKWARDIEKFSGEKALVYEGDISTREAAYGKFIKGGETFLVTSYDTLRSDLVVVSSVIGEGKRAKKVHELDKDSFILNNLPNKFCLIFDEVQYIKTMSSQRSLACRGLSAKFGCVSKVGLTATYIETGLQDLFGIMYVIDKKTFGTNFVSFSCQFLKTDFWGGIKGYKNEDIASDKMKQVSVRRTKPQVQHQLSAFLPKVNENTLWVEMSDVQKKLYNEVLDGVIDKMNNLEKQEQVNSATAMTILGLLIQASLSTELFDYEKIASAKVDTLLEILPDIIEDNKVVIFCHYIKFVDIMEREFNKAGLKCIAMHGGRVEGSGRNRQNNVDKFSNSKDVNILLTSDILREGIDIPAATYIVNTDILWNPSKMIQRNGRHDRLNQKAEQIFIYNIWAKGTIEESIYNVVYDRYQLALKVMDDGKEEERVSRLTFNDLKKMLKRV
jgi:SNF2 family DNA or RNA helicase